MFDFTKVETREKEYEPLPNGRYVMELTELESKTSRSGKEYLKARFVVLQDKYKGRSVYHNFNINADNEIAKHIAMSDIKLLLESNKRSLRASSIEQLINLLLNCKIGANVKLRHDEGYAPKSEIRGFFALTSAASNQDKTDKLDPFGWGSTSSDENSEDAPF